MITNISINKLFPHPDNPRKQLGDLKELANSIKANGIFQNLTVVPNDDDTYTIIIGHRRKAAAEIAGLKELPCAIVEMTEKEQLSTMLLENMQRSDLTVYEQAQGFQLMLDLGESVENISKQTGFSKTTIYHRVHLLKLDPEEFKKSQEREISINDYIKLEQLKSTENKNAVLKVMGTSDFEYRLKSLLEKEKREEQKAEVLEYLKTVATDISSDDRKKYSYKTWNYNYDLKSIKSFVESVTKGDSNENVYYSLEGSFINFYVEKTDDEITETKETAEEIERKQKFEEVAIRIKQTSETMSNLRKDFLKEYKGKKEHFDYLLNLVLSTFVLKIKGYDNSSAYGITDFISEIINIKIDKEIYPPRLEKIDYEKLFKDDKTKLLLLCICSKYQSKYERYYNGTSYEYAKNEKLDKLYEILETVGYQMSEEEKAFKDGTHKLFEEISLYRKK
ncbi:MAG: ParB/RepB/Spo0J family partition protein [Ruminococcus sp.]